MEKNTYKANILTIVIVLGLFFIFTTLTPIATGEPFGVQILSNVTDTGPSVSTTRADAGGTITTLSLNVSQQVATWKGYVGNITGQLVLQDSDNYTLYDWALSTINGEVYATRQGSVLWPNISCADHTNITAEYANISMAEADVESINNTFNATLHAQFDVGGVTIANSTCPSLATYQNSTGQNVSEVALFQEVLLDDTNALVYTTILEQDLLGYRNESTYDFQMIIPDSDATGITTTYYFYAELG